MVIITGMHRSGTSLVANIVYELDASLGDRSFRPHADTWNPKGYFESAEVGILNDRLIMGRLAPARAYWTTRPDERNVLLELTMTLFRIGHGLPTGRRIIAWRAHQWQSEIRQLAEVYRSRIVKDPRFSLTIGLWARYTPIERTLYCFRHPFEVARSLQRRYHIPLPLGYWLWARHIREFFEQAQGLPVIMIQYERLLSDDPWDELRRISRFIGRDPDEPEARSVLARVRDGALRHSDGQAVRLPPSVERLYAQLRRCHALYDDLKPFHGDQ